MSRMDRGRLFREALFGGLVAYLAAAVALGLLNAVGGRSVFHTAAGLGSLILERAAPGSQTGPILAYNGIHLTGSIAVAAVVSLIVLETERHRSLWYFFFIVMIAALVYSITLFGVFGVELTGVIGWPAVVTGSLAWVGSLTAYMGWRHRSLARGLRSDSAAGR